MDASKSLEDADFDLAMDFLADFVTYIGKVSASVACARTCGLTDPFIDASKRSLRFDDFDSSVFDSTKDVKFQLNPSSITHSITPF